MMSNTTHYSHLLLALLLAACFVGDCSAFDSALTSEDYDTDDSARFLFTNFTSSLVQVNSTLLAYTLIALAIGGAAAVALYYLYIESANNRGGYGGYSGGQGYDDNYGYQQYSRSAKEGYGFNTLNVIQWISMMQEVYEKFDYSDIECQKRVICELMQDSEYFGNMSNKMKTGFRYAKYLEVLNMPDDFREILDEYIDASERATGQKGCEEVFECPYSLKNSIKRNFAGNSL